MTEKQQKKRYENSKYKLKPYFDRLGESGLTLSDLPKKVNVSYDVVKRAFNAYCRNRLDEMRDFDFYRGLEKVGMYSENEMDYGTPEINYSYLDVLKEDNRTPKSKLIAKFN